MRDFARAIRGAALSAFRPDWAAKPKRLARYIDELAAERGVSNWFERYEPETLHLVDRNLHVDRIRAKKPIAAMVFMPGTNGHTLLYGEYLTALADRGIEIFAFDPRGHGRSTGKRGSYTIPDLVEDFRDVLKYVRGQWRGPLFAGGSSQGGIVAFYTGLQESGLAGLICHNLADLGDPTSVELTRLGRKGDTLKPAIQALAKLWPELPVPMMAYLDLQREPVRGKRHALQVLLEDPLVPWFVRARTLASLGNTPLPRALDDFQTPVLILQAEKDTIFPTSYIRRLAARIPHATVLEFPHTAHYLIVDHADVVVPQVRQWVDSQLARTSTVSG